MPNIELLQKVMQFIKDNPERHDQSVWMNSCGTAGCFAGWTCVLSGDNLYRHTYHDGFEVSLVRTGEKEHIVTDPGVRSRAMQLLGLKSYDAGVLFAGLNTIEELDLMVKDISNGERPRTSELLARIFDE